MAYIGQEPANSFISFEKQVFTIVNSQTAYTLSHAITNENDIRLVINNVIQEPGTGKAYTASGTTLTLSAALTNGTDEMYCVYLGRALQTVNPSSGSVGTSQLDSSLDFSSKTITLANNMKNTPAFLARQSSGQTFADGATTLIQYDAEVFDTDNAFDTSTYRFTPQESGKYYCTLFFQMNGTVTGRVAVTIQKNGSNVNAYVKDFAITHDCISISSIIDLNGSSDYLSFNFFNQTGSSITSYNGDDSYYRTSVLAYKIVGA